MGTHPIFESDFDCLTEMNRLLTAVKPASIKPAAARSMSLTCPSYVDKAKGPTVRHNWRSKNRRRHVSKGKFGKIEGVRMRNHPCACGKTFHAKEVLCPVCYNVARTETNKLLEERRIRMENYIEFKTAQCKERGMRPIDIEEGVSRIRDDFVANGIFYDPKNMSRSTGVSVARDET